jgi:hypothetical protein
LICPPVMITTPSAENISTGLKRSEPLTMFELASSTAKRKSMVRECDAARSNVSLVNNLRVLKPACLLLFAVFCMIHQVNLVTGLVLISLGAGKFELVNDLYGVALLLRTPGFFQALLRNVEGMVQEYLVIIDDQAIPVDPTAADCSRLILLLNGWDPQDPDLVDLVMILNDRWRI